MRKLVIAAILFTLAFYAFRRVGSEPEGPVPSQGAAPLEIAQTSSAATGFRCDGRTHCSQMTSCAEATYFLRNCPGVKMDGEGDGVPCEKQWCGRR